MKRLLLAIALLILCLPLAAQDATNEAQPDPTNQTVEVIDGEGGAPSVTCEEGSTCVVNETPVEEEKTPVVVDNSPLAWVAIGLSALTAILVAISMFLQRAGNRAEAISNDPSAVSILERGYDTVLPDMVKTIVQPLKESLERSDQAVDKLLVLLNKVTDGVPESSKVTPAPTSSVSSTGGAFDSTAPRMPGN